MAQLFGLSEEPKFKFKGLERWLMAKSTYCFPRGPWFDSWHSYHGPRASVALVSGDPLPSFGICGLQAPKWFMDIHEDKSLIHIN